MKHYRLLIAIPAALLVLSLAIIANNIAVHGSFLERDVELTGGITLTIKTAEKPVVENVERLLPGASVRVAESFGSTLLIIQTKEMDEKKVLDAIRGEVSFAESDVEIGRIDPAIGEIFWSQAQNALIIALVLMGFVVLVLFRAVVPSFTVIGCAVIDIIMTVAAISLLGVNLSLPVFAGLLMLLGYSVDTDILLTTRVLKGAGTLRERIISAVKTGLTMTSTSMAAVFSLFLFSQGTIVGQISLVLLVGLLFDMLNTWITNVLVLEYWLEKKGD